MKYLFFLAIIGAAVWYLANRPPQVIERIVQVPVVITPAPVARATPAPVPRATPATPRPVQAPSLATILQPAFARVFASGDNTQPILAARVAVQQLPATLGAASDARDPRKLSAAQQLWQLLDRAIRDTDASLKEKADADSKPSALNNNPSRRMYAQETPSFFGTLIEKRWREDIARLRAAAQPLMQSLGAPDPSAMRELEKASHAQHIQVQVSGVISGGVLADLYQSYAIASYSQSVGLGGGAAAGYEPSGKTVYIQGFPDGTEGQKASINAYRDGSYPYGQRTLERWVFVGLAQ